jgi:hypothetical protein
MMGGRMLGYRVPRGFGMQLAELFELSLFGSEFWQRLGVVLKPLFWPYFMGSTLGALLLAAAAYYLALAFIASRRRIRDLIVHHRN